ncbi:class III extradiol ring-cleavage dioxygenase [Phenylobacterium sp.]|uniref:DODA-type extradiol aromatic ring-opening family dioxygenase n=1 Tax=Phenylobacterium sp. TaxID=1871053 RepID=UPI0035AEC90A
MGSTERQPTLFIPHGGGPCFFMDPPPFAPHLWDKMGDYLRAIADGLPARPKAILVISGHWETPNPTVNVAAHPKLLYDYYGFPEHTYRLTYPAPGAPDLAGRVRELLGDAGFPSDVDADRGLDHGVFIPLKLIYPDADVPVLQMSLREGLDPAEHLAIGRALAPLRDEGVLIIGSGLSYHNLRDFFSPRGNAEAEAFDAWLAEALADPAKRDEALIAWSAAPGARACHPREEHLLPLMVAAGAAEGEAGVRNFNDTLTGKPVSGFQFG